MFSRCFTIVSCTAEVILLIFECLQKLGPRAVSASSVTTRILFPVSQNPALPCFSKFTRHVTEKNKKTWGCNSPRNVQYPLILPNFWRFWWGKWSHWWWDSGSPKGSKLMRCPHLASNLPTALKQLNMRSIGFWWVLYPNWCPEESPHVTTSRVVEQWRGRDDVADVDVDVMRVIRMIFQWFE